MWLSWVSVVMSINCYVLPCFQDTMSCQLKYSFNWRNGTSLNIISLWLKPFTKLNSAICILEFLYEMCVVRMKFVTCIFWCTRVFWGYNLTCNVPGRSAWTCLWSWQVQLYCFRHQLEVLGGKHSRSPKVWNKFDYSSPGRDTLGRRRRFSSAVVI